MPYNYRLSEQAESDVYETYLWYEKQRAGLGEEFLDVLNAADKAITDHPTAYRIRYKKKVRAFVVDRFPYLVLYVVEDKDINFISVFNTNQNPKKRKKRVLK